MPSIASRPRQPACVGLQAPKLHFQRVQPPEGRRLALSQECYYGCRAKTSDSQGRECCARGERRRAGESHLSQDSRDCAADAARDEPGHLQSPLITCLSMHLVMASGRDSIPVTYVTRIWIPSHSARAVTAKPHSTQSTQTALQSRYPHPKEVRETDLYIPIAGRKTACTA